LQSVPATSIVDNHSYLRYRGSTAVSACNLSILPVGKRAIIQDIVADDTIRQRMKAMGLRAGREAWVVRAARLGGPLQIRVGSVSLILRRSDAARISVIPAA
jgi:ferrous iron transport protein A